MFNRRLIHLLDESMIYVKKTVLWNCGALVMNILFTGSVVILINQLFKSKLTLASLFFGLVMLAAVFLRALFQKKSAESAYFASCDVKKTLRASIFNKLIKLSTSYQQQCSTSEVVQVAMEGVDQLEIYFGRYLPQLFTSLIAPIILFVLLVFVDWHSAVVLLICVPLIPISIVAVQKFAKKLLSRYWGAYTGLSDSFLENLEGLTTLKIYEADERKTEEMDREAEHFRKITMKVLTMQLNSISVMDLVAYGGAAVGIVVALLDYQAGLLSFAGCLLIILLAAEFFIPLRLLGSFFHIAMNGMAASDKIFKLLDLPEPQKGGKDCSCNPDIKVKEADFSYEASRAILKKISMEIPYGSFVALVGQSGCGKSTLAKLLCGILEPNQGEVLVHDTSLYSLSSSFNLITRVTHNNHLFKGTIRYNLQMASAKADESEMWEVLEKVNLADFVQSSGGLEMELQEGAANLSGGQRQRLNLARALLRDTPIYLFDEATSNIDVESEKIILEVISSLRNTKTLIMISHRLDACFGCDQIFYMENGEIRQTGTHDELMQQGGGYAMLVQQQKKLLEAVKRREQG